ncbi:recombinase zinc beta ribbon domain-containing protein [Streptomyces heilongjiangensis]|uniref:Recombinase zinc beta ribbon domain-containing protein n=1 Tax=Streptomyces heilongjiangensis TaxID=945052 RepID=A0ABW1BF40_9ACTN|nr:recombinase zinc beta ribbon domain-containing protein [Streptomyces heilongjiangensis]MDC2946142.1 recombinase zinc beta ribbon domain-containing protein [Streptomyces heilongjiangensis]
MIADEALAGKPLVRIARMLNEHVIPSPRGGLRQVGSLSQLPRAPAFAGLLPETETVWDTRLGRRKYTSVVRPYRDPETGRPVAVGEGIVSIVSIEEQQRIVAEIESRTQVRGDGVKRPVRSPAHLLTGLLRCAVEGCGARMSRNGASYVCQGVRLGHTCPGARAMAVRVEEAVVNAFLARNPGVATLWQRSDVLRRRALLTAAADRIRVTRAEGRGYRFDAAKRPRIVWVQDGSPG